MIALNRRCLVPYFNSGQEAREATVRNFSAICRLDDDAFDFLVATAVRIQIDLDAGLASHGRGSILDRNPFARIVTAER